MLSEWKYLTLPLGQRGLDQSDLALTLAVQLTEDPYLLQPRVTPSANQKRGVEISLLQTR